MLPNEQKISGIDYGKIVHNFEVHFKVIIIQTSEFEGF